MDEYIPVIKGSEMNDDPFHPISRVSKDLIHVHGDSVEIEMVASR